MQSSHFKSLLGRGFGCFCAPLSDINWIFKLMGCIHFVLDFFMAFVRLHAPQIIYGDGHNFQNHGCLWTSTWWYLRDQHRELERKDGTVQCGHKSISVAFRRHCFGCKRLVWWPTQVILLPPRMSRGSFIPVLPAVHTFNLLVVPILTSKS